MIMDCKLCRYEFTCTSSGSNPLKCNDFLPSIEYGKLAVCSCMGAASHLCSKAQVAAVTLGKIGGGLCYTFMFLSLC